MDDMFPWIASVAEIPELEKASRDRGERYSMWPVKSGLVAAGETGWSVSTAAGRPAECDACSGGVIGRVLVQLPFHLRVFFLYCTACSCL